MKYHEKAIFLIIISIVIVLVGTLITTVNLNEVLEEQPDFLFYNESATLMNITENQCLVQLTAKITNSGGPADDVIVKIELRSKTGVISTKNLPIGDLSSYETKLIEQSFIFEECPNIANIFLDVESFE